jgi:hypothetical protein
MKITTPSGEVNDASNKKNRGLFATLLGEAKRFIKDDISDQDFLK